MLCPHIQIPCQHAHSPSAGAIAESVAAQLTDQDLEDLAATAFSPQVASVLRMYATPPDVQQAAFVSLCCSTGVLACAGHAHACICMSL